MRTIADLHIHSSHSRACGKELNLQNLEKFAKIKGISLLGTGDFTHPQWIKEIKAGLAEDGSGILRSSSGFPFILQTEISLAYTQGGKGRRIHHLLMAPDIAVAEQITRFLLTKGRVDYDGRPIFGFSSIELVEKMNEISKDIEVVPAHAWTPYFGVFGSESGFDSLKECFGDKTHLIHAIETGMSSDPAMNWRVPFLDNITLLSNSDLHSYWPWRIGREANVFEIKELSYKNVLAAIREREGLVGTIEVDPGYGKYHFDGHRLCGISMSPSQSRQHKEICPKCGKAMTIGVMNRIEELSQRPEGYIKKNGIPFKSLIPLSEVISELNGWPVASKKTWLIYNSLIEKFGNEFSVMLDAKEDELSKAADDKLADAILRNRQGKIQVRPGYDGEYGKPMLNGEKLAEVKLPARQRGLSDYMKG